MSDLPSASESPAVQEALSIMYVDKIGLAWLPEAKQWAVFSNAGKLVHICDSLREEVLQDLCESQDRAWRHAREREAEGRSKGPVVTSKGLEDLDL